MQQYGAAVATCMSVVRDHGHALGKWYPVDERLHASLCVDCGDMVWVARSGHQEGWRVGGGALKQGCPEQDFEVGLFTS